jgi:hypothetical protein
MTEKDTPELTLNDGLTIGAMFGFGVGVLISSLVWAFVVVALSAASGRCG